MPLVYRYELRPKSQSHDRYVDFSVAHASLFKVTPTDGKKILSQGIEVLAMR
jgi:hypothetical protein